MTTNPVFRPELNVYCKPDEQATLLAYAREHLPPSVQTRLANEIVHGNLRSGVDAINEVRQRYATHQRLSAHRPANDPQDLDNYRNPRTAPPV